MRRTITIRDVTMRGAFQHIRTYNNTITTTDPDNILSFRMARQLHIALIKCRLVFLSQYEKEVTFSDYKEQFNRIGLNIEDKVLEFLIERTFEINYIQIRNGIYTFSYARNEGRLSGTNVNSFYIQKNKQIQYLGRSEKKEPKEKNTIRLAKERDYRRKRTRHYGLYYEWNLQRSKSVERENRKIMKHEIEEYLYSANPKVVNKKSPQNGDLNFNDNNHNHYHTYYITNIQEKTINV